MRRQAERGSARLGRRGLGASEARRVRSSRALDGPPDANNHRRRPRRRGAEGSAHRRAPRARRGGARRGHRRPGLGRLPRLRARGGRARVARRGGARRPGLHQRHRHEHRRQQVPGRARGADRRRHGRAHGARAQRRQRARLRRRHDGEVPRPRVAAHLPRDPLRRGAAPAARGQDRRHRARARTRTREGSPQMSSALERTDPEVFAAIQRETERQEYNLELIASENVVSEAVLEAQGPILPNKYAEGYPGRRYYGGCQFVDEVETLAIARAKALFGAEAANVQPHSGSQANMSVYFAQLEMGATILSMNLAHGGHLTHGSPVNFSGKYFRVVPYGVRESDGRLDTEQVGELARRARPKMIVVGHSAYPRALDFAPFRAIADEVGATLFADMAHFAGLVAAGIHPSPVPHCEFVTTTTHKTLRGPRGGMILCRQVHAKTINASVFPGNQGGPLMHVIAAKAVALKEAASPEFAAYQRQVVDNAQALGEGLVRRGFRLASGGTDNHLLLVDLRGTELSGKVAQETLDKARITVNKNAVPFDSRPPFVTSGIRLGTPAVTTRGMREPEMDLIADLIRRGLEHVGDDRALAALGAEVRDLCARFPIYPGRGA